MYKFSDYVRKSIKYSLLGCVAVPLYNKYKNSFELNKLKKKFDEGTIQVKMSIYQSIPRINKTQLDGLIKLYHSNKMINNNDAIFLFDDELFGVEPHDTADLLNRSNEINTLGASNAINAMNLDEWQNVLSEYRDITEENTIYKLYNSFKKNILTEIDNMSLIDKINAYRIIYDSSFEFKSILCKIFNNEIITNGYIDISNFSNIENLNNVHINTIELLAIKLIIMTYPNREEIIDILANIINENELDEKFDVINKSLLNLNTELKERICLEILIELFNNIRINPEYKILMQDKLNLLFSEISIIKDNMDLIVDVFFQLPSNIQAMMMVNIIKFIKNNDINDLIKNIINDGGVVFIKLSQILAEDPKTPAIYVNMLNSSLSNNKKDNIIDFWNNLPNAIKKNITHLGICIGTGSIKQIHKILYSDNSIKVIASIKNDAVNNTIEILNCLNNIESIKPIIEKLGELVYNELNLYDEYKSFSELEKYADMLNVYIPQVFFPTPKAIIREYIEGVTIDKMLLNINNDSDDYRELLNKINEFHKNVLNLVFKYNIILSDIHFGNIIINSKNNKFTLIDPAQLTKITKIDIDLINWLLISICSENNIKKYLHIFIKKIGKLNNKEINSQLIQTIENTLINIDTTKERFNKLLYLMELNNINMPISLFAFAKLYDNILSQHNKYLKNEYIDINVHITNIISSNFDIYNKYKYTIGYLFE